ncbi:aldo/keto reductase [Salicibibacter halophilus]|uniref:Aldo/keto reductase n=1 Tax=Salicibibacter halophilus TaxID=2502791 RepID=A0A514LKH7_9BACI|nr:aldo/keto reductase [Salicibibacter halophilus]QDI92368.1 aldo/keto reductase [Salicibibacter halophilus]
MAIDDVVTLNNGVAMPKHGFGVYKITERAEAEPVIERALDVGFQSFDTAQMYGNEALLGKLLSESGVKKEDVFITTKIDNDHQGYDAALFSFERSLEDLQGQIDLLLVHWPSGRHFFETWKALERLYDEQVVRAIGVSNYTRDHLEKLLAAANVKPAVNQIECHPYLSQYPLKAFLKEQNIAVEAWSPLGRGAVLGDPQIESIAKDHGKTVAQVILRWHLQQETVIIPKTVTPDRVNENAEIYDFALDEAEMETIDRVNKDERNGPDPDEMFQKI